MVIELLVVSLAVWRLSSMLVNEAGPWDIFVRLRAYVGVKYDEYSQPYGERFFAKLLSCVWCLSIWISVPFAIMIVLLPKPIFYLSLPFALSAVAIFIEEAIIPRK